MAATFNAPPIESGTPPEPGDTAKVPITPMVPLSVIDVPVTVVMVTPLTISRSPPPSITRSETDCAADTVIVWPLMISTRVALLVGAALAGTYAAASVGHGLPAGFASRELATLFQLPVATALRKQSPAAAACTTIERLLEVLVSNVPSPLYTALNV